MDYSALARAVAAEIAAMLPKPAEAAPPVERALQGAEQGQPGWLPPSGGRGVYAYEQPYVWSIAQTPTRKPYSLVDTWTLRRLADTYDILRSCIQHLKREVAAVPMQFVPVDSDDKSEETQRAIREMEEFCREAGGLGGPGFTRGEFEAELIEDVSVIGAAAVYYHPTRGGWPFSAEAVDAATIRPIVDVYGWPPDNTPAFEQWVNGVKVAAFTREQMSYRGLPICRRSWSPYYWSAVEWLIFVVQSALKADEWNRAWLTDGNSATETYALPAEWTPSQVREWSAYWDSILAGDTSARVKTKWVPGGSQKLGSNSRKDQDFQEFELWLLRRTCSITGVQPASIGFAGEQYKVSQEASQAQGSWFGVAPLLTHRKSFYDDLCVRMGYPQIEAKNVTAREEDAKARGEKNVALVSGGLKTINEARKEEGLDPVDGGDTLLVPAGLRPLEQALEPPEPPEPPGITDRKPAERGALRLWERKALNRMRQGKAAACEFESAALSDATRQWVSTRLPGATSAEAVRALFRNAQGMNPAEAADREDWAARVQRELLRYNHNHDPRTGEFSSGGGLGGDAKQSGFSEQEERTPSKSAKAILAQQTSRRVDRAVQQYSEERCEPILAKGVGGVSLRDNEPADVLILRGGKVVHGIELKTMTDNKNNKITMKSDAMARKAAWMEENNAPYHTVVFDDHAVFNADGEGAHGDDAKRVIYYRRGYGSFRVGTMYPCKDMAELRGLLDTPDGDLPKAARPPANYPTLKGAD